jgi:hypothetical protein
MPRYSSYGALDSQQAEDGDTSFQRVNSRLRPDQLKSGDVAYSKNGRMDVDGCWQTRKGYRNVGPTITSGTGAVVLPINLPFTLNDGAVNSVYGSCLYSDPNTSSTEYIVLATNSSTKLVKVSDPSTVYTITYPGGRTIDSTCDVIQAFQYLFIFRDGNVAFQWDGTNLTASPAFTLVDNGAYTQPVVYNASANTAIANGIVTVTAAGHIIEVGDLVMVSDKGNTDLNPATEYRVYEVTGTTFKFKADASNITGATIAVGKRQSIGLGFTHMPAPPWAIYHQRRLWMPFYYTMAGTSGTPTITSRKVRDEIIASDILDQNTYDQIQNQYKIASGSSDYLVALQPFAEDNIVAFARNSIHLIRGVGADLGNSSVQEITREVGCVSRKSVLQVGNQIIFLSDNGVYAVDFDQLYNLRGASVPLSEAINPTIKRINKAYAQNSVAVYHDNRYYISIPLDSSTVNNAILIYNFLNQGWESVDEITATGWNVSGFVRAGAGGLNKLFSINKDGGIHLIDEIDIAPNDYQDYIASTANVAPAYYDISSYVSSRQYTFGTIDRKKFNSYELHLESVSNYQSDANISFEVENPDAVVDLGSIVDIRGSVVPSGEDVSLRARIGNKRGYGGQFTISPSQGRPKVRAIKVNGMLSGAATVSTE